LAHAASLLATLDTVFDRASALGTDVNVLTRACSLWRVLHCVGTLKTSILVAHKALRWQCCSQVTPTICLATEGSVDGHAACCMSREQCL